MDPNETVDDMINIISTLDGMRKGTARTDLLRELGHLRKDLRGWKARGGFEPRIGWTAALAL